MQMSSHCGADMKSTIIETYAKICTDDKYSDSEKPVMVSANNLCKEYDEKNYFGYPLHYVKKNNAITAFIRQIEAENITSSMYVMCTERKKCKINKINLEHYLTTDISEKIEMIKNRQYILNSYKENDVEIIDLDKSWEEKIKKVLKLLLKFICFSLKLLPEQSTFLLDFEKMGVLQLTDIQKTT
ncbi:hypothetical protein ACJJTC_011182 [Scirpophaga incertulas]